MTVALDTLGAPDTGPEAPESGDGKKITGKSPTAIAFGRLRQDKVALVSGFFVVLLFLLAILAPVISNAFGVSTEPLQLVKVIDPVEQLPKAQYGPPLGGFVWSHPLGVDPTSGNDNFAFLLYGLRTDLAIAVLATVFSTLIGLALGLLAGFLGGWVDQIIQFFTDMFLSFPYLLGALALAPILAARFATNASALSTASFLGLCAILVLLGWMQLTRLIRGTVIQLREREFVHAAKVLGVPTRRTLTSELLPNLVAPIVVAVSLSLPAFVTAEAGLTYLGVGVNGVPSLGVMITRAVPYYNTDPIFLYPPVIVLAVLVLALNLLGDSVRDAFDPGTRR